MCARAGQALNASQRIAVIEVKDLTGEPGQAGQDLQRALHMHLQPPPSYVHLNEAAASHSHAVLQPPAGNATAPRASAPPLPAALVVVNMTFGSPEDASKVPSAALSLPQPWLWKTIWQS